VRDNLDAIGFTERTLFPGLDGLCNYLRRYYTPRIASLEDQADAVGGGTVGGDRHTFSKVI